MTQAPEKGQTWEEVSADGQASRAVVKDVSATSAVLMKYLATVKETWVQASRLNGKPGGYRFIADAPRTDAEKDRWLTDLVFDFRSGILSGPYAGGSPEGMCFAVCVPLQAFLSTLGVHAELIEGEVKIPEGVTNHYWLQLEDGRTLCATADQFNRSAPQVMPPVYLGEKPTWYRVAKKRRARQMA